MTGYFFDLINRLRMFFTNFGGFTRMIFIGIPPVIICGTEW